MRGGVIGWLCLAALLAAGCSSGNGDQDPKCGNSEIDQFEACDGANLNGLTCIDLDFASGELACTSECQFDTSLCVELCGNGQLDSGEACDGEDLNGKDCTDLGYDTGTLACDLDCSFDAGHCEELDLCGNAQIDDEEDCDGVDLGGQTCLDLGLIGGDLSCDVTCLYDTSGCEGAQPCGNGELDSGEECDGADLNGMTCVDLGYFAGELACRDDCLFDTSECVHRCGNLAVDDGEDCDGLILNGQTCLDLGFTGGDLSCSADCQFDTGACLGDDPCGNLEINYGEDCDGSNLDEASCQSLGFFTGTLGCTPECLFDLALCSNCGNGSIDTGEACDGAELGGVDCTDLGYAGGDLVCAPECLLEVAGCSGCTDDSFEENDDQTSAVPLNAGEHQLVLCNELGGESDWYSLELLSQDTLAVLVNFNSVLVDLDLELRALDGELLDSSTTTTDREQMLYTASAPQTVYLQVYPYDDEPGVVTYSLSLIQNPPCLDHVDCPAGQLCEDYTCIGYQCSPQNLCPDGLVCSNGSCVECRSSADCPSPAYFLCQDNACIFACPQDMFEPNSQSSSPALVGIDFAEVALTLCGEHDEDWFQLELLEYQQYSFGLTFTHADGDIDVQLHQAGNLVTPVASGLSSDDHEEFGYTVPEGAAGPHLLRVWLVTSGVYGQTYDMTVIQEAPPECLIDEDCQPGEICVDNSCVEAAEGDTCSAPIEVAVFPYSVTGVDMAQFTWQLEFDSNSCTGFGTAGRDVVYQVSLAAGRLFEASLTSTFDGALYLVDDCSVVPIPAATSCLAGADAVAQNGTEIIQYTAPNAGTFYLVVDHYSAGGPASGTYDLELTLQ